MFNVIDLATIDFCYCWGITASYPTFNYLNENFLSYFYYVFVHK